MATQFVLKLTIRILSAPLVFVSRAFEYLNLWGLKDDLSKCLNFVDASSMIPSPFVLTLIVAEDHRNALHQGVDPIGIIRAVIVRFTTGQIQGASTIEQQLVRVATGHYQRTMRRKLREQILAIALSRRRSKSKIASSYLSVAFYGFNKHGKSALLEACSDNLDGVCQKVITSMIARLKYPEPLHPSSNWHFKITRRENYIYQRLGLSGYKLY